MREILFKGNKYYLTSEGDNSPIATQYQYENGICSFAHLKPDGNIYRYGEIIGRKEDIIFTGNDLDLDFKDQALENLGLHKSWNLFP